MRGYYNDASPGGYTTSWVNISFNVPCFTSTPGNTPYNSIIAQAFATATPYQIAFSAPTTTVLAFPMHWDSAGNAAGNKMHFGAKTYTTDKSWATVLTPASPGT